MAKKICQKSPQTFTQPLSVEEFAKVSGVWFKKMLPSKPLSGVIITFAKRCHDCNHWRGDKTPEKCLSTT